VDSGGDVVGVNSAIASLSADALGNSQSGNIGLGFAIPINEADRIATQIIHQGYATHAIIGVSLNPVFTGSGAQVGSRSTDTPAVTPGGPADRAGIQDGDVIVGINGEKITTADEAIVAIRRHAPGEHLSVTYLRAGGRHTVTLTLGSRRSE
jgi:putative serine protease PepD